MTCFNVLIVDDQKDLAASIAEVVELEGHRVTVAHSGEEAIERAGREPFGFVFLDIKLPGIDGIEAFMRIREMQPQARFVMMTGYTVEHLLEKAVDEGAVAILRKPFDMEQVVEQLRGVSPKGIVLIADDDADLSANLESLLATQGYQVCAAWTGKAALECVLAGGVDLLVLDLRLPVLSGLEVYLELKQRDRAVPTIIITGFAEEETAALDQLRSMEVTGCLFKPFDPAELLQVIERAIAPPKPASQPGAPLRSPC